MSDWHLRLLEETDQDVPTPRELVSQAEIARRFGVTRTAVGNWRRRNQDTYPAYYPGTRLVYWDEVSAWKQTRRSKR